MTRTIGFYSLVFLTLFLSAPASATVFGKIGTCTRVDLAPAEAPIQFYVLSKKSDENYSKSKDAMIVFGAITETNGKISEPAGVATLVDIVRNRDGSFTIADDGIYGDAYTFKDGKPTINKGQHATFSCQKVSEL